MKKLISVLFFAALFLMSNTFHVDASTDIAGPSIIHKESNQVFTIIDLLSLYEDDVFVQTDGYTGYGNVPGEYTVVLTKGLLTKDVTVKVIEDWGNLQRSNDVLFVTNQKDIYVSNERKLTLYEIIYYIYSNTGYVETEYNFRYEELVNEYHTTFEDQDSIPSGIYEFTFRLTYYSGEQATYSAYINVIELPDIPGIVLEPPPSTMDRIMGLVPWILGIGFIYILFKNRKQKRGFY